MNATCVPPSFILSGKYFILILRSFPWKNKINPSRHVILVFTRLPLLWDSCTVKGQKSFLPYFNNACRARSMCFTKANSICLYCDNNFPFFACFKLRYFPLMPLLSPHYITGRGGRTKTRQKINPLIARAWVRKLDQIRRRGLQSLFSGIFSVWDI